MTRATGEAAVGGRAAAGRAGRDEVLRGIGLMVASVLMFALINPIVKWLAPTHHIAELAFCRHAFALVPALLLVRNQGGLATLRTRSWRLHLLRGALGVSSMLLFFYTVEVMPLADAIALSFSAPLFVAVLSAPLLGERVGPWRWGAVLIGFAGVLIMSRPTGAVGVWGAAAALLSALLFALVSLTLRRMSGESSAVVTFYYTLIASLCTAPFLPFVWTTPRPLPLAALLGTGLLGWAGQYLMTRAFALAPASALAPFNYTNMLWAVLAGWLFWGELPGLHLLAGVPLVVGSGLVILWRERAG